MTNRIVKVVLRGEITDLQAKMAVAAKSVGDTADKMTGASKASQEYRRHLSTLGTTAGAVGLVAAAGLAVAVAAAARFDSAMSKVQAATHESAANMDLLRAAAIKAGADTVFSATEAADAVTALAKANVSTKDILSGGLTGALSLASAGELDVASAAEIAATAMNQFGLAGKDIPHVADLLAAGAGKAMGEVTDFAAAMKFVGPVAHQMGISIEETTGTIAELAQQGILGEQAGTSLRGMLTSLTSPSVLASKTMKQLGINLYDATGNFVGLEGVAGQLQTTMGTLTNAERDQALGRIFGNEQITAARILYAGGAADVEKWTRAVNDEGYAAETAAIKMDNLKGDLEQLRGSFETALIGLGEGSQGPLRDLVQTLTGAVNAFNDLPGPIKNVTTAMLGITAITGGGLWFGSKVIRGVADTRAALDSISTTAPRAASALGSVSRAATGLGIALAAAYAANELLVTDQTERLSKFADAIDGLGDGSREARAEIDKLFHVDNSGLQRVLVGHEAIKGLEDAFNALDANGFVKLTTGRIRANYAEDAFRKADAALTEMVTGGRADDAAQAFDYIAETAHKAGVSADELSDILPGYTSATRGSSAATQLMSDALTGLIPAADGVTTATGALGTAVAQSATDLAAQAKALEASRKAANDTAHEFVGLADSLDDSKVSLGDWIDDLRDQAKALRDFTKNAKEAGKKGLKEGLIAELEAAGPAGALRLQQLADASEKEIHRANRAWSLGQKAIDAYTDTVGGVPPAVATDLSVTGVGPAISAVAALKRLLDDLHDRNININVTKHTNATLGDAVANADGGTIPHAAAGWTVAGPRDPYGDKVLAYLAPGEEVITNRHGEADQFRADRAAGRIPAYAAGMAVSVPAGAYAGATHASAAGGGSDWNRLLGYRDARNAHIDALRTVLREIPIQRVPNDLMYGMAS